MKRPESALHKGVCDVSEMDLPTNECTLSMAIPLLLTPAPKMKKGRRGRERRIGREGERERERRKMFTTEEG